MEKIVNIKVDSFLCVPVARKGSEDLIALACLVNKLENERSVTKRYFQAIREVTKK